MPNTVGFTLPTNFIIKIKSNEVCVFRHKNGIKVREAIISDEKTLKINRFDHINFTCNNAKDLIGLYEYEIENDFLILFKKLDEF